MEELHQHTVCVFLHHTKPYRYVPHHYGYSPHHYGYSLLGLDIRKSNADEQGWEIKPPRLLVQLETKRQALLCAQCGSKFYFLGGYVHIPSTDESDDDEIRTEFTADVLMYDPTDPENLTKDPLQRAIKAAPMNSYKLSPTTFEVDGKLYVLGANQGTSDENYCTFEVYDPVKNEWTKLPDPPLKEPSDNSPRYKSREDYFPWPQSYVVNPRKVLIGGSCLFAYNTVDKTWSTYDWDSRALFSHPLYANDYFYGISRNTLKKSGPCPSLEDDGFFRAPELPDAVVDWDSSDGSFPFGYDCTGICHFGDNYFGIVETVLPDAEQLRHGTYRRPSHSKDRHAMLCSLIVIIHKELQGDYFKLKFLHEASFDFIVSYGDVSFRSFHHVMNAEGVTDKNMETDMEQNEMIHIDFKDDTDVKQKQFVRVDAKRFNITEWPSGDISPGYNDDCKTMRLDETEFFTSKAIDATEDEKETWDEEERVLSFPLESVFMFDQDPEVSVIKEDGKVKFCLEFTGDVMGKRLN